MPACWMIASNYTHCICPLQRSRSRYTGRFILCPEGFKAYVSAFRVAFPDLHATVEDQIAEEGKAAMRFTARGTHKGEFQGIPPTGKQVTLSGIDIQRIVDGKIVENWVSLDALGLLQQLGVLPPMG